MKEIVNKFSSIVTEAFRADGVDFILEFYPELNQGMIMSVIRTSEFIPCMKVESMQSLRDRATIWAQHINSCTIPKI